MPSVGCRLGHERNACCWTCRRRGRQFDGLHRQRDELHLRPGLDARAPEDGRRPAGRCRPAQGRSGRVPEGTHSVVLRAAGRCLRLPDQR